MRARLVAVMGAAVVLVAGCSSDDGSPEPAAGSPATSTAAPDGGTYLALGDSVPFGYRAGAGAEYSDAGNFVGYPELVADDRDLDLINASCPGETTASFLDPTAPSFGCENLPTAPVGFRTAYPLHVPYASADQSQLDFAVDTLRTNDDIGLVTLQIGANDAFLCRQTTPSHCADPADSEPVARAVEANVDRILSALREDAGYDGQIVVVTYYALDYSNGASPLGSGVAEVAASHGADVADGFAAFRNQSLAAGGSAVAAGLVLPEDVHPSAEGQRLLADAVLAVVD